MLNYTEARARRIQQFVQALDPMPARTVQIAKGCCYLVIEEREDSITDSPSLEASKVPDPIMANGIGESLDASFGEVPDVEGWSDGGWRNNSNAKRFVQFVYYERHFELDLPRPMLWPSEARTILAARTGFYFLRDRERRRADRHDIVHYDPLRKPFVHGDSFSAAEEIAYLFFDLWHFPIDARFYLDAFGQGHSWESGRPLE